MCMHMKLYFTSNDCPYIRLSFFDFRKILFLYQCAEYTGPSEVLKSKVLKNQASINTGLIESKELKN